MVRTQLNMLIGIDIYVGCSFWVCTQMISNGNNKRAHKDSTSINWISIDCEHTLIVCVRM